MMRIQVLIPGPSDIREDMFLFSIMVWRRSQQGRKKGERERERRKSCRRERILR